MAEVRKRAFPAAAALVLGFLILGASESIEWLSHDKRENIRFILRWELMNCALGLVVSLALCAGHSRLAKRLRGVPFALSCGALCYVSGALWRFLGQLCEWLLGFAPRLVAEPGFIFIQGGLADGTTLGLLSFLYFGIESWRQAKEQKEAARQATALAQQAQLQMLRYQLNPHFLFNALNSIRGMIVEDPVRSREMVTELSDFLRYSLHGSGEGSTIGDEMQAIRSYLAIQRIRFEEQLDAGIEAEESTLTTPAPSFLIHPLVENAIKYGMKTSAMPLQIRIRALRQGGAIRISVENTGRLVPPSAGPEPESTGAGIGLRNITERLKLVYPERHAFRIAEDNGWVRAEITLQLADSGVAE